MPLSDNKRFSAKKITVGALLACIALTLFVLESMIPPPIPIPGIKIGLANTVTLCAFYFLDSAYAFMILTVRIILANMFAGQAVSLMYSVCGGFLSYAAIYVLHGFFDKKSIWALGVVSAVFHNAGQLLCACVVMGSAKVLKYGAVLGISACITGTFTGLCAQYVIWHFNKLFGGKQNDNRLQQNGRK